MLDFNASLNLLFYEYKVIWNQLPAGQQQLLSSKSVPLAISSNIPNNPLTDNGEMMQYIELQCLLKSLRLAVCVHIYGALSKSDSMTEKFIHHHQQDDSVSNGHATNGSLALSNVNERTTADRDELFQRLEFIDQITLELNQNLDRRLSMTRQTGLCLPRIVRLCDQYEFSEVERNAFYLAVVVLGSRQRHILSSFLEDEYLRRTTGLQRLAGMAEVDMEIFCNSERMYIKEGMVLVEDDQGVYYNLRVPRTAVQLCYGRQVKADDMLIIAQTCMEDILALESTYCPSSTTLTANNTVHETKDDLTLSPSTRLPHKRKHDPVIKSASSPRSTLSPSSKRKLPPRHHDDDDDNQHDNDGYDDDMINSSVNEDSNMMMIAESIPIPSVVDEDVYLPYPANTQLEYLEEGFSLIGLLVRSNAARIKDDMKKEGTRMNQYWDSGEVKQGKRELQAKIMLLEKKMSNRVQATRNHVASSSSSSSSNQQTNSSSSAVPRLESFVERLSLDKFERNLILLLIGKIVSPVIRTLIDTLDNSTVRPDDGITVGQALNILCQDFVTQINNRQYFYKSSKMMIHGVISLTKSRWHAGKGDLTEQRITLDRRVLDSMVGLDSEINELVEGSDLYEPTAELSQLVLPSGHLDMLLTLCAAYDPFLSLKDTDFLTKRNLSSGNSLVVLLCGKPGTGKTMTVNAIAKHLRKKVLLVDLGALIGRGSSDSSSVELDLRGLFREASMNNALIFFDECENIFRSRGLGNDRMLNTMLTEIERHSGLVFLATNLAYELDEAMHRRITCIIEYRPPDAIQRKMIWMNLLNVMSSSGISSSEVSPSPSTSRYQLAKDVNIDLIAMKYELTGGFIKNAVLSALLCSLHRDNHHPTLTQEDLVAGCKLQMRGSLIQRSFEDKMDAKSGLDGIYLNTDVAKSCQRILRLERARAALFSSSSSLSSSPGIEQRACIVAMLGPSGSGKRTAACALAAELHRSIKYLHVADILSTNITETLKSVRIMLTDARLADAVFIIDGFEHVLDDTSSSDSSSSSSLKLSMLLSRLFDLLESYSGLVVLLTHVDGPQHVSLHRELAAKLFECVRFVYPTIDIRAKIWNMLIPKNIVLGSDISALDLGRRYELYPGSIASAITRAVSEASTQGENFVVKQEYFTTAAEIEVQKLRSGNFEIVSKLFI